MCTSFAFYFRTETGGSRTAERIIAIRNEQWLLVWLGVIKRKKRKKEEASSPSPDMQPVRFVVCTSCEATEAALHQKPLNFKLDYGLADGMRQ